MKIVPFQVVVDHAAVEKLNRCITIATRVAKDLETMSFHSYSREMKELVETLDDLARNDTKVVR